MFEPTRWSLFETKCLKQLRLHPKISEKLLNRPQYIDVVGDRRMLRFLRGHQYDIDKTAEKVFSFLEFRDKNKVDDIRNEILFTPLCSAVEFPHGKRILQTTKHDILAPTCTDADGNPMATEYYAFDGSRFTEEVSKEEYLHFMLYALEYRNLVLEQMSHNKEKEYLRNIRAQGGVEANSKDCVVPKTYGVILRINIIRDFSGLTFSNFLKTQTVMAWVLELASNNYPETLEKSFIVNAPWFFNTMWLVLSNVLERRTVDKMKVMGSSYLSEMERDFGIPVASVPTKLGGRYCHSNVSVQLARPPSSDWQSDALKAYRGPFGLRKVVRRVNSGQHVIGDSTTSAINNHERSIKDNKVLEACDADTKDIVLLHREDQLGEDLEPEEGTPLDGPVAIPPTINRCGCI